MIKEFVATLAAKQQPPQQPLRQQPPQQLNLRLRQRAPQQVHQQKLSKKQQLTTRLLNFLTRNIL